MIYLYYGDDVAGSRSKLEITLSALLKNNPEAEVFKVDADNFSSEKFDELIVGQTLFYQKYLVVVNQLGADENISGYLESHLKNIADSLNIFFFLEEGVESPLVKALRLVAAKEIKTSSEEKVVKKGFNLFAISDAFSSKKRQDLWVVYQRALLAGFKPEEIFWKLEWATKNLLLVKISNNPADTGLAPYPLQKALREAKNFSISELYRLHGELVDIFHSSRAGNKDLQIELEKFILGV